MAFCVEFHVVGSNLNRNFEIMMNSNDLLKIQGDMDKAQGGAMNNMTNPIGGVKLNPMDLARLICRYWYWFVGTTVLALIIAWVKLKSTEPVYTRTASVLIKDKSSGGRVGGEAQVFQEVKLLGGSASVQNEMLIFKTERLSREVVRRLGLETTCLEDVGLRNADLYGRCPITVEFQNQPSTGSFTVEFLGNSKIRLSHFEEEATLEAELNKAVKTPMGLLTVKPTMLYSNNWTGRTLTVLRRDIDMVARQYSRRLVTALATKESSVVNLTLNDVSAQRAEDYLNTLVEVYREDMINDKNQMALNTDRFINERLAVLEQDLGGVDGKIASFKQQNKLTDLVSEAGLVTGNTNQIQQEGFGLENQLQLVEFIRGYLTDPAKMKELIPSNTGVADVNIESQISEYNKLLLERDKLLKSSGSENPVVMEMNEALELSRQAIVRAVDNAIASLKIRIQNMNALEARSAQRLSAVPQHEKYMLSVERQQKVKEQLYVYLLQKREENALAQSITESNARLIEAAKGPAAPISPKALQYYLIALVIGLGLPLAYFILVLLLDNKVRSRKDIEDNSTLPFLGDIPYSKEAAKNPEAYVVRVDGKDPVTEAFRILRTNIGFMADANHPDKVLMTTSMNPDAGKTFIIANLAAMMAFAGKKVLLIDLDIRKGALTKQFGGRRKPGITHYLVGQADNAKNLIHPVADCPGLDIIYCGVVPPNPAELLLSERLDQLVDEVKADYDYVLIDNVPMGVVADATITNRLADRTLFIARAGVLDRRQLPDIERFYQEGKMKQMALVLNGVKEEHAGYGHYGYYGYGYGYGYQEKKKKKFLGLF